MCCVPIPDTSFIQQAIYINLRMFLLLVCNSSTHQNISYRQEMSQNVNCQTLVRLRRELRMVFQIFNHYILCSVHVLPSSTIFILIDSNSMSISQSNSAKSSSMSLLQPFILPTESQSEKLLSSLQLGHCLYFPSYLPLSTSPSSPLCPGPENLLLSVVQSLCDKSIVSRPHIQNQVSQTPC